jgi:hypothetical protein
MLFYNCHKAIEPIKPHNESEDITMKIAVNKSYGGFILNEQQTELISPYVDEDFFYDVDYKTELRTNEHLIKAIEQIPSTIKVVEIPDNATDWIINEYDGFESVYYVVDGKIKRA